MEKDLQLAHFSIVHQVKHRIILVFPYRQELAHFPPATILTSKITRDRILVSI